MIPASTSLPADIAGALNAAEARGTAIPLDMRWYASVGSTMAVAAEAVEAGAPEGFVVVAEEQTAGRGRRGRRWSSPAGAGLYLSLVLRPVPDASDVRALAQGRPARTRAVLPLITIAAGVAVREAISRASGLAAALKWPNDLLVARRKLAGILAEGSNLATAAQSVILGIGVNVRDANHPVEVAARATSLEAELGRLIARDAVLEELLVAIPDCYMRLQRGGADDILRAWSNASPSAIGSRVSWETAAGPRHGVTAGIDNTGSLLVQTDRGLERIVGGELTWE